MNRNYTNRSVTNPHVDNAENFKIMFEALNVPMAVISLNGQFQKANKAFCTLTGFDENEIFKMNILNFSTAEDYKNNLSLLKQLITGKLKSVNVEKSILKKNGELIWAKVSAVLLKDTFGNAKYVGGILEDITHIKKAEKQLKESESQYRRFFDEDLTGDFISSPEGKILMCNQAFVDLLKCKNKDEVLNMNAYDLYWKPGNREEFLKRLKKEKKIKNIELELKGCDGSKISVVENVLGVFNDNGDLVQIMGYMFDITKRKEMESALKESEQKFRSVFENSPLGKSMTTLDGKLQINKSFCDMLGYTYEELNNIRWEEITHPDDIEKSSSYVNALLEGEIDSASFEKRYIHKNKKIVWTEVNTSLLKDNSNKPLFFITSMNDITERKNNEAALLESEKKYRKIFENVQDIFFLTDGNGYLTEISPSVERHTGYTREEILKTHVSNLYHDPKDREIFLKMLQAKGEVNDYEVNFKTKYGKIVYASMNAHYLFDENNNVIGAEGSLRDITERKKIEESLKDSEAKYREVVEQAVENIFTTNNEGYFTYANPAALNLSEYSMEELSKLKFSDLVIPEYQRRVAVTYFRQYLERKAVTYTEYPFKTKSGDIKWFGQNVRLIIDNDQVKGFYVIARDITERKKFEEALKTNEEKLNEAQKLGKIGSWEFDINNQQIQWSDQVFELYERDITLGPPSVDEEAGYYSPRHLKILRMTAQKVIETGQEQHLDFDVHLPQGKVRNFFGTMRAIKDEKGNVLKLFGTVQDITERKNIEITLQENERMLKTLFGNLPGMAYRCLNDKNWTTEFISEGCKKLTGYSSNQLIDNKVISYNDIIHPEDRESVWNEVQSAVNNNQPYELVYRIITSDKKIKWVWEKGNGIYNEPGTLIALEGFISDITESKLSEDALKESEEKFRSVTETATDAIITINSDGIIQSWNKAAEIMFGYCNSEAIGFDLSKIVPTKYWAKHSDAVKRIKELDSSHLIGKTIEIVATNRIGIEFPIELSLSKWSFANSVYYTGMIRNISERKKTEEQILLLSRAVEKSPATIMITDDTGKIEYVNQKFIDLSGYSLEEVKGKNPRILKSGTTSSEEYKRLWDTIKSGKEWRGEFQNKKKNGELYWETAIIAPIKNGRTFFLAIKEDISERKKAEELLNESKERFEQVALSADEWIWEIDINGLYTYSSKAIENILGYSSKEIIGKKYFYDLFDPEIRDEIKEQAFSIMKNKEIIRNLTNLNLHKNGTKVYLETNGFPIIDSTGNLKGYRGADKDITERRRIQKELIAAKEKAEESDKLKSEFLAQMSHEIRTPINIITNNVDFIKEELVDKVTTDNEDLFDSITLSSKRIIRTIDLILNMSEIKTGLYNPRYVNVDLHSEVLEKLFNEHKLFAKNKNIELVYKCKSSNTKINVDEYSVNQIFANLIDNAIKYTKQGKVEILLDNNPTNELFVQIKDTGIGMSKEFQQKMFDAFVQEEQGYNRSYDGNGLGLALVKKYCDLNNANIDVKSEKSVGSIFTTTFKGK